MDFNQVEERFRVLKRRFASGDLTEADFKAQLEELMVEDERGHWWMLGYETERWYRHDGTSWVQQDPPGRNSVVTDQASAPALVPAVEPAQARGTQAAAPAPAARRKPHLAILFLSLGAIALVVCAGFGFFLFRSALLNSPATEPPAPTAPPATEAPISINPAEPTSTPEPTTQPSPATSTAIEPSSSLDYRSVKLNEAKTWKLVMKDTFVNNDADWSLLSADDANQNVTAVINNGAFLWGLRVKTPDRYFWKLAPPSSYEDFYYSVKIKRNGDPGSENNASWGILFRKSGDSSFYTFRIADSGRYAVQIHNEDGWTPLIDWTRDLSVDITGFNELAVVAEGPDMYFFINGTPIGTVNDTTFTTGRLGFTAALNYVKDESVYFEFDDFELREKP